MFIHRCDFAAARIRGGRASIEHHAIACQQKTTLANSTAHRLACRWDCVTLLTPPSTPAD
jgi:hypothetical protein